MNLQNIILLQTLITLTNGYNIVFSVQNSQQKLMVSSTTNDCYGIEGQPLQSVQFTVLPYDAKSAPLSTANANAFVIQYFAEYGCINPLGSSVGNANICSLSQSNSNSNCIKPKSIKVLMNPNLPNPNKIANQAEILDSSFISYYLINFILLLLLMNL